MSTIRAILSLSPHFGWDIQQYDVKYVFLHGDLKEEIYMEIPPGSKGKYVRIQSVSLIMHYMVSNNPPRAWFGRFT